MNAFTDLFIRRPVLASVVSLLILLVGGMAAFRQSGHQSTCSRSLHFSHARARLATSTAWRTAWP